MNDVAATNAHERRRIAVAACVDPTTVRRYLAIRSTCRARIEQALAELKRLDADRATGAET